MTFIKAGFRMAVLFGATLGSMLAFGTCIVSLPEGERDPNHSLMSTDAVSINTIYDSLKVMDSSLEMRYKNFGISPGIGMTTLSIGFQFTIR